MSLLTKVRGTAAVTPQAPGVAIKLQAAEERLAALEARHDNLALDKLDGVDGAAAALDKLISDIAAAKADVVMLYGAHSAAVKRDDEVLRDQRAALRKTQLAALKANLDKRDAAAAALAGAIKTAVEQWKILVLCSDKAQAATPIGDKWPEGGVYAHGQLQKLVAQELYRRDGGDPMSGNRFSFPGAAAGIDVIGRPDAIDPLDEVLRQNSAWIVASLTGKEPK